MKKNKPTIQEELQNEIQNAKLDLAIAQDAFNNAAAEYIEIAIINLNIAELNLDNLYRKAKLVMGM